MGSEYKKPDATTVINHDNYKALLWPMPINKMFFVGSASAEKLMYSGIKTIGDLANSDKKYLSSVLGIQGEMLYDYSNGNDDAPVSLSYERKKIKSVGNGMTFKRNLINDNDIKTAVIGLSDRVSSRLRKYEMKAGGVKVEIKNKDLRTISRQRQLTYFSNTSNEISKCAYAIIKESWTNNEPIRLLTITGINLHSENESEQLNIFNMDYDSTHSTDLEISKAMDRIRNKYGESAISFGRIIGNDIGIDIDFHDEE